MSNVKFYATKGKNGNPRHLLVATGEEENGRVPVERVGFHPDVQGINRRGKRPNFVEPVEVSALLEVALDDVPEDVRQKVMEQFAPAPGDVAEAAGDDSEAN